jgi:hypothetical protein
MSLRLRLLLALAGLALIGLSLALLAYTFWPVNTVLEQFQPAPTLFAPPQAILEYRSLA